MTPASDAHTYYVLRNVILPVREHFCSPLLQFEAEGEGEMFTLNECPSVVPFIVLKQDHWQAVKRGCSHAVPAGAPLN